MIASREMGDLLSAQVGGARIQGLDQFGSGPDGDLVFDGTTTVLGHVPSANVYTLTRDIHPNNMTVNVGVRVKTGGTAGGTFAIFGKGTLTNNGQIDANGNDAVTTTSGAGFNGSNRFGSSSAGGSAGVGGVASVSMPSGYYVTAAAAPGGTAGNPGTVGTFGQGGGGGGGAAGSGGTGGAITAALVGSVFDIVRGRTPANVVYTNGSGGGSGGGGTTGNRGAGGGGGSICCVYFPVIAGTGTIEAKGGAGAASSGDYGGGGGGGGGTLIVAYRTNPGPNTFSAAGGVGGASASGAGANGGPGRAITLNLSGDAT